MNRDVSTELYEEAKNYFPGGVSSPVRAFKSVKGTPLFIRKGQGYRVWDEDDNEFIDFCCSWGPLILGHNNEPVRAAIMEALSNGTSFGTPTRWENRLGKLILENNKYIEKLRFVSSGTEAVMSAVRLARAVTGKNKIIKFEGCYHGHVDSLLVKAGSGLVTFGETTSAGIPPSFAQETIVLPLNDPNAVEQAFQACDDIAAIIIEPIPANNGLLLQLDSFLSCLRKKCYKHGALLIFDEVISGFRVGFEGAAGLYGIQPDIITYGKIIGGGMPVGAYGASSKIMSHVAPEGPMYQAGTLSGNPVAMAAGYAALSQLLQAGFYETLEARTQKFVAQIDAHCQEKGYAVHIQQIGSIYWLAFTESKNPIRRADEIAPESMEHFKKLHAELLDMGVYFGPSGYEVGFVSAAHNEEILELAAGRICLALDKVFSKN